VERDKKKEILVQFIKAAEIAKATRRFNANQEIHDLNKLMNDKMGVNLLSNPSALLGECAVQGCPEKAIE